MSTITKPSVDIVTAPQGIEGPGFFATRIDKNSRNIYHGTLPTSTQRAINFQLNKSTGNGTCTSTEVPVQ